MDILNFSYQGSKLVLQHPHKGCVNLTLYHLRDRSWKALIKNIIQQGTDRLGERKYEMKLNLTKFFEL